METLVAIRRLRYTASMVMLRWQQREQYDAFMLWRMQNNRSRKDRTMAKRALEFMRKGCESRAYEAWHAYGIERAAARGTVNRVVKRLSKLLSHMALSGWSLAVARKRENETVARACIRRMTRYYIIKAIEVWQSVVIKSHRERKIIASHFRRMQYTILFVTFRRWVELRTSSIQQSTTIMKHLRRMRMYHIWRTFYRWRGICWRERFYENTQRFDIFAKSIFQMRNLKRAHAFNGWRLRTEWLHLSRQRLIRAMSLLSRSNGARALRGWYAGVERQVRLRLKVGDYIAGRSTRTRVRAWLAVTLRSPQGGN